MPSVGSMREAIEAAVETLAASVVFQDRVGVDTADLAKRHITLDRLHDNAGLNPHRPFALIKVSSRGSNQVSDGIAVDLVAGGGVIVYLTDNARVSEDHQQSYLDFLEFAGRVMDDMEGVSGYNDYLPFHSAEMLIAPIRTPLSERTPKNDFWEAAFLLNYGNYE